MLAMFMTEREMTLTGITLSSETEFRENGLRHAWGGEKIIIQELTTFFKDDIDNKLGTKPAADGQVQIYL